MLNCIAQHWFGIITAIGILFLVYALISPWGDDPMGGP